MRVCQQPTSRMICEERISKGFARARKATGSIGHSPILFIHTDLCRQARAHLCHDKSPTDTAESPQGENCRSVAAQAPSSISRLQMPLPCVVRAEWVGSLPSSSCRQTVPALGL